MKLWDFQRREDPQITKLGCILSIVGMVGLIILYYLAMTSRDYYLIRVLMATGFVFSLLFPILRLLQKPAKPDPPPKPQPILNLEDPLDGETSATIPSKK
jgi:hypothetical protein